MKYVEHNTNIGHNVINEDGIEEFKLFRFLLRPFILGRMLCLKMI